MLSIVFILGASFGSFASVLIHRLPMGQDVCLKRSYCPHCLKVLSVLQLVPILGYLWQKGRCKSCGKPISLQYICLEIGMGLFFVGVVTIGGWNIETLKLMIFLPLLWVLMVIDWRHQILPNFLTYALIIMGLGLGIWRAQWQDTLLGILAGFTCYFVVQVLAKWYYKKDALGQGDLKLGAAIGAWWGLKTTLVCVYLSFLLGGLVGAVLLALGIRKKTDFIPFGPAIGVACVIAIFYSQPILRFFHF